MTLLLRAEININGLTLTDLSKNGVKEVCFLFILTESMLKNTITYIPRYLLLQQMMIPNTKYAALSAAAIFNCACAIRSKPLNVC